MTAREVSVVIRAARWRDRRIARRSLMAAWQTAAWQRSNKMPSLKIALKRYGLDDTKRQTPDEAWGNLKAFATNNGIRVTRRKTPLPRPVFH